MLPDPPIERESLSAWILARLRTRLRGLPNGEQDGAGTL